MTLALIVRGFDAQDWASALAVLRDRIEVQVYPEIRDPAAVQYAAVWKAPAGALTAFPNLRLILSLGAGVDHIWSDPTLPDVPVCRFVDPDLTARMTEYAVFHVLFHHRRMFEYQALQRARRWQELAQPAAGEVRVGIMGLGMLGRDAAEKLLALGFQVRGWSRGPKHVPGIACFAGAGELDAFLAQTDILVCLLPLTPETRGILNLALFGKLARDGALPGPVLINAGRGGLQIEADILRALDDGVLAGASLDVFETEPLPEASRLWAHPRVLVTPHCAAVSAPEPFARYALRQIERVRQGLAAENLVDPERAY
jgi:glyoxylate/hydroxypyruvate reductase A